MSIMIGNRRALLAHRAQFPSWLPKANGVPATLYADFANGRYWYQGQKADHTAWLTALGGTFSRSSTGYRTNASGLLESVSSNVLRFDYDPSTLLPKGILLEGARTNLALRSQEFDNAAWSKSPSVSISANALTAPDGAATAEEVTYSAAAGDEIYTTTPIAVSASTTYAASLFVKKGTSGSPFKFMIFSGGFDEVTEVVFNLDTKLEISHSNSGANLAYFGADVRDYPASGYVRLIVIFTTGSKTSVHLDFRTSGGAGTVGLWGAQLEAGSFPSSYVPTTSGSATRAADAHSFTIPSGVQTIRYTFDDDTTQDVSVSPGAYTVPTNLSRPNLKSMAGFR